MKDRSWIKVKAMSCDWCKAESVKQGELLVIRSLLYEERLHITKYYGINSVTQL